MSGSDTEDDSSDCSYQGTTEDEDSDPIFSIQEVVQAAGVDFGKLVTQINNKQIYVHINIYFAPITGNFTNLVEYGTTESEQVKIMNVNFGMFILKIFEICTGV